MSEERSQFAQRIDERKFSLSRRGYDKREVRDYLEDLEQAFRELEGHGKRTAQRVADLERDLHKARATEKVSVDNAMMAVFDAKDRILERARRRADEIEEEAHAEAGRIKAAALTGSGGAPAGELEAARAQADEIVAAARREADRVRRDAQTEATEDMEAELAATAAQLRRAHADTASAREELDAARKRIVELESGMGDASDPGLEQRFAELESHLSAARDDIARLEGELAARDSRIATLEAAVAAADNALDESKTYVAATEAELEFKAARIEELQTALEKAEQTAEPAASDAAKDEFVARLREAESLLASSADRNDQASLISELKKATSAAPDDGDKVAELETAVATTVDELATAHTTIEALRAELVATATEAAAKNSEETDSILEAAREEAKAIVSGAEQEAEQRAAKVIAKAREEAEQVRQTVATLTAQAEEARSAAVRSKMEADDLAEAQRSMSQARDDIVTSAKRRAEEIEEAAARAAKATIEEADAAAAAAEAEAARIKLAAEQEAAALVAAARAQADELAAAAEASRTGSSTEDELDAMLAAAEQEVALSEELRLRRAELDQREQALIEMERALAAKQEEAARHLTSARSTPPPAVRETEAPVAATPAPVAEPAPAEDPLLAPPAQPGPEAVVAEVDDDDEDPAELLSALLEQVASPVSPDGSVAAELESDGVDLDLLDDEEPRPRMAWPTPARLDENGDEVEDGGDARESRYRSRSAQLPRLGTQAKSNMTTMANLRKRSRGANDD